MILFARVVEAGSFTAAAKRLGRAKSSVSREIAQLEARLDAQLLRRTTRTMSLTEVGEIFFERCLRVAEEAEAAELSISRLRAAPSGTVRLAAPMSFGQDRLAPELPRFLERHPEIRVELELTDRTVDLVHERIDLSVRIGRPRRPTYVLRRLCPIRVLLVGAQRYLEAAGTPESPADLERHNCLGYRGPSETWFFSGGRRLETRGSFCADNAEALRHAALDGVGLVYLPTHVIGEDVRTGRLISLLESDLHPGSALFAVYPESRHLSPKVRATIDWLVEIFGPDPIWDVGLPVEGRRPGRQYLGS